MIVVSCAIGAYAIQNAMFDIWLMLVFGVVGYAFKKIGIPLAPFTLALVLLFWPLISGAMAQMRSAIRRDARLGTK